ncbi:hypothetical protein GCM10012287_33670 [Streptomyces daqingensis]|uniref:Uncharacterized protein n=1 Tax=Streptomyces daqingensis TaxID=1472640 RepID=A0ABQ2MGU7_9ACTN|nr:hypothetical protein GCM10012287_33670 [Streptomyces daqingensis]
MTVGPAARTAWAVAAGPHPGVAQEKTVGRRTTGSPLGSEEAAQPWETERSGLGRDV